MLVAWLRHHCQAPQGLQAAPQAAPQAASQAPPTHSAPPQAMSGQGFPQQQFATRQPSSLEIQLGYEWIYFFYYFSIYTELNQHMIFGL